MAVPVSLARRTLYARIAYSVAGIVLIVLLIQTFSRALRPEGNDFTSYLAAARAFWSGQNPYTASIPFPFLYPLTFCVVLYPLLVLQISISVAVWFTISIAALAWTFFSFRALSDRPQNVAVSGILSSILLLEILQNNLLNGQINCIQLVLIAGFYVSLRQAKLAMAALWLAVAIALKLTPALLLVYLLVRKEWLTVGLVLLFTTLLLALPCLFQTASSEWYAWYWGHFLQGQTSAGFDPRFFSLTALATSFANGPASRLLFLIGISALVLGPIVWLQLRSTKFSDMRDQSIVILLYLTASLLLSPISETHHLIVLLPGMFILLQRRRVISNLIEKGWSAAFREISDRILLIGVALVVVLLFLRSIPGTALCAIILMLLLLASETLERTVIPGGLEPTTL